MALIYFTILNSTRYYYMNIKIYFSFVSELVAYWDNGYCGAYGDDFNWDWCGANSGEPCKEQVQTHQCPSGIANLKTVEGDQNAVRTKNNYQLNGCWFTYYATYSCSESGFKF